MPFSTNPREGLTQFFELMWGSVEGFVYTPAKNPDNTWKKTFFHWPEHKHHVVNHVLASVAAGKDVYFSPAIFNKPWKKEINRSDILGSYVVWADFDKRPPEEWGQTSNDHAGEAPGPVPGRPSVEVQSSTEDHRHVYWRLDEFQTDPDWIEGTNRAIAYTYGADTSGWDIGQLLRPPYTTSFTRSGGIVRPVPLPVLVCSFDETSYDSGSFASLTPVKELVKSSIDYNDLPKVEVILGSYRLEPDTLALVTKEEMPEGSRSSAMMRIAFHCCELGMTDTEAYAIMLWVDDKWGKFKTRNDRVKRLLDIVNKARQKFPHKVEDPTFAGLLSELTPVAVDRKLVYGFVEFNTLDLRVEWEVTNLIPQGGLGVIASPPNVGKTQFVMNMAMKFGLGIDFLGWQAVRPHKNLLLSCEMGDVHLRRFTETMATSYTPDELASLQENFLIAPIGEPVLLFKPEGKKFLESLLEQTKVTGVYIDSLGEVVNDLMSDQEIRQLWAYLRILRNKFGCYFCIIHHTRKPQENNKKPNRQADIYGSQYIMSGVDFGLSLWEKDSLIEVTTIKNRLAERRQPFNIRRVDNLQFITALEADTTSGLYESASKPPESGSVFGFS